MMKELAVSLYLFIVKLFFNFFKLFPLRNKTVFVSSFGDNAYFLAKEMAHAKTHRVVFINQKRCNLDFLSIPIQNKKIYSFETANVFDALRSIYHLATSKYVFIDNYFGILSAIQFRKEVKCVQLWHAAGAIKKFGWGDPETSLRSSKAQIRFQQVYDQFQFIPVGSKQMSEIFSKAFNLDQDHFLYTGVPLTDFYFDEAAKSRGLENVKKAYPVIEGKKVILYAPTFRKNSLHKADFQLDIAAMLQKLGSDYVLMIRLHPSIQEAVELPDDPNVLLASSYPHLNELLVAADILITDYSSIPVEFSLLRKKMIFFAFDREEYGRTQGLWAENSLYFPGPIVENTAEVIGHVLDPAIDYEKISHFSKHWNTYSTGDATRKLLAAIYGEKGPSST